jgi:hypothetical protein
LYAFFAQMFGEVLSVCPARFNSKTRDLILMKRVVAVYIKFAESEFSFSLYWSNI